MLARALALSLVLAAPLHAAPPEVAALVAQGWKHLGANARGHHELRNPTDGSAMILVPAGHHVAPGLVLLHDRRRGPRPAPPAFLVGKHEVSWARYLAFCAATRRTPPAWPAALAKLDDARRRTLPVVGVSGADAAAYAAWAGGALPTSAQWDRAAGLGGTGARAFLAETDVAPWPWGHEAPLADGGPRANFAGADDGFARWAPVTSCPAGASVVGCLHMAGNVWEWVGGRVEMRSFGDGPGEPGKARIVWTMRGGDFTLGAGERRLAALTGGWRGTAFAEGGKPAPTVGFRIAHTLGAPRVVPPTGPQPAFLARMTPASIALSPDGTLLATGSKANRRGPAGTIGLLDPTTGETRRSLPGHRGSASAVAFAPDGTWLVSGGDDGRLVVRALADGKVLHTHDVGAPVVALAVSARGAIAAGTERTLTLWTPGAAARKLPGFHAWRPGALDFSPDGARLAGTDYGGRRVRVWTVADGAVARTLPTVFGPISLAFSADGTRLAVAASDLLVWQTADWSRSLKIRARRARGIHRGTYAVAWTPDGARLISGEDHKTRIYDARSGRRLFTLRGQANAVQDVCVTPDGNAVLTLAFGVVRWPMPDPKTTRPHGPTPTEAELLAADIAATKAALTGLAHEDAATRARAAGALHDLDAVPPSLAGDALSALGAAATKDAEAPVRLAALSALGAQHRSLAPGREGDLLAIVSAVLDADLPAEHRSRLVGTALNLARTLAPTARPPHVAQLVKGLTRRLADGHGWQNRTTAARTLGALGAAAKPAVPLLLETVASGTRSSPGGHGGGGIDDRLAREAATALGAIDADAAVARAAALADGNYKQQRVAVRLLIGLEARAIPTLLAWLADVDREPVAIEAMKRLGRAARAAVPKVVALARTNRSYELLKLLDRLGFQAADHVDLLLALLDDPDRRYQRQRQWAERQLANAGAAALPILAARLTHDDPGVRRAAVSSLGGLAQRNPRPVEGQDIPGAVATRLLPRLTVETDATTRSAILSTLGRLHPRLGTDDQARVAAAVTARARALLARETPDRDRERARALDTLGHLGAAGLEALEAATKHASASVREQAYGALGRLAHDPATGERVVTLLLAGTRDKETRVRRIAVNLMGQTGARGIPAVDRLIALLADPDRMIARAARRSLSMIRYRVRGTPTEKKIAAALAPNKRR